MLVDADLVTLGGLAVPLRAAAPDQFADAFTAGLMTLHRNRPPESCPPAPATTPH